MIYPANYDITILQNSTWRAVLRATQQRKKINSIVASGGVALFNCECHKLESDDAVVVTIDSSVDPTVISLSPVPEASVPCGLELNDIYYVISSGLTGDQFYVSSTISGQPLAIDKDGAGIFYVARPISLSGYTIDADITGIIDNQEVATFVSSGIDLSNGLFQLSMSPTVSSGIEPGRYNYDVSLTTPLNERYYWLTGVATVQRTYSRN
jgi:hypothetical protein